MAHGALHEHVARRAAIEAALRPRRVISVLTTAYSLQLLLKYAYKQAVHASCEK